MSEKALYVKIADRIDNLNTLSGVKESKRIPKAEHTREIIIPMVKLENAYRFVDILEELCFQTEHPQMYEKIKSWRKKLLGENSRKCQESLDILSDIFDPHCKRESDDLDFCRRYIVNFIYQQRSCVSIFRQLSCSADNIKKDREKFSPRKIFLFTT